MSKKAKVKISKLVLEIDGKKIELSMKQAKELQEVLNDSFGDTETVFRDRWHYNYPYNPYPYNTWCSSTLTATSTDIMAVGSTNAVTVDDRVQQTYTAGNFEGCSIAGSINESTMTLSVI